MASGGSSELNTPMLIIGVALVFIFTAVMYCCCLNSTAPTGTTVYVPIGLRTVPTTSSSISISTTCRLCAAVIESIHTSAPDFGDDGYETQAPVQEMQPSAPDFDEEEERAALATPKTGYVELQVDVETYSTTAGGSRTLSKQQLRVRKRKEWLRRLDANGTLYWYRGFIDSGEMSTAQQQSGFVVAFRAPASSSASSSASKSTRPVKNVFFAPPLIARPAAPTPPPPAPLQRPQRPRNPETLTSESVKSTLKCETESNVLQLMKASDASPEDLAVLSNDENDPEPLNWTEVLQLAAQDFPTKYAHFVTTTASLIAPRSNEFVTISVSRDNILGDSMQYLSSIPRQFVRSAMRIRFLNERGIDAGGLQREWFALLSEQLASPASGVFRCVNKTEQTFYLNPSSQQDIGDDHLVYCYGAGRLLGRALLEEQVCGFHLALPLLKLVLGVPVTFGDLEYFDPEVYASLVWIRDHDGVGELGLTFSMTETVGESCDSESESGTSTSKCNVRVVDLVENGRDVDVTDDNKLAYLDLRFRYVLFESVSSQLYCFLKGFYEVIPQELLMLFDPEELDYLLCGSDEIDVDDWERNTKYTLELHEHHAMRWFWEVVREMPNKYRRRLLHFATGSSRVPVAGFRSLTSYDGQLSLFALHGVKLEESEYIWSHACFNRLGLPLYESREKLKVVLYGVLDLDLYGFTTE